MIFTQTFSGFDIAHAGADFHQKRLECLFESDLSEEWLGLIFAHCLTVPFEPSKSAPTYPDILSPSTTTRVSVSVNDEAIAKAIDTNDPCLVGTLFSAQNCHILSAAKVVPVMGYEKSLKPLPYQGVFGIFGKPYRYHFQVSAHSPAQAASVLRRELSDAGCDVQSMTIHRVGLGSISSHDLLTRHEWHNSGISNADTSALHARLSEMPMAWKEIVAHCDNNQAEIASRLRSLAVDSGLADKEAFIDYPRLAASVMSCVAKGNHLVDHPPLVEVMPLEITDDQGQAVVVQPGVFSFTDQDMAALKTPPDSRFKILHNIVSNRPLTLREQYAWCRYYETK